VPSQAGRPQSAGRSTARNSETPTQNIPNSLNLNQQGMSGISSKPNCKQIIRQGHNL
jgi:hypothetical protein